MATMNKQGSTTVEAALVLPIVIISIIAVFTLAVLFYEELCTQVELHFKIRESIMRDGRICKYEADFIRKIDLIMEGFQV